VNKTVLITGASSGIGQATALFFQQQGWNVAATMRSPETVTALANQNHLCCLALDVTQPNSIEQAIAKTLEEFGSIDAIVNNAGYSLTGAFEDCTPEQIEKQFATNVFGLMAVTRAVLPHFRQQGHGLIINVASIGGHMAFPLYSMYHATKWAVEGFSESLQYELQPLNIRVKVIEPGPIKTDFYGRSADVAQASSQLEAYQDFAKKVMPQMEQAGANGSPPEFVAKIIYKAATDGSWKLRYPAGGNASALLLLRKLLPDSWFSAVVRQMIIR
jgi:NADP-dependent 3-hydroxy acid dehydrogenase YdfG